MTGATFAVLAGLLLGSPADAEPVTWTVDRIVDGRTAVLELETPAGLAFIDIPTAALPDGTREGSTITLTLTH